VRLGRLDSLHVRVPLLSRVQPQLGRGVGRLADDVERVFDVPGRERLAVVPLHVLPQEEDEIAIVVLPRPLLGQLGDDRLGGVNRLERIEDHEVREARRHRPHAGDGSRLVDGEAGRVLDQHGVEDAAALGRLGGGDANDGEDDQGERDR
jgi:hypothetical protein